VKREAVTHLVNNFGVAVRRACAVACIARSTYLYPPKPSDDMDIVNEIDGILAKNSRYGCGMIHLKLRQKGIRINHKRTERIYREQRLQLHSRKRRKKITSEERISVGFPERPGMLWALDFIHDSVGFGRKLKILTSIDPVSNFSPVIHSGFSITGKDVSEILARACENFGYPEYIQCDNGPEFRSAELDRWCYENRVKLVFTRPGKPTDNCHIESFNGTFRNECLNVHYFGKLSRAEEIITNWWREYNEERPQKRLKGMTPKQYNDSLTIEKTQLEDGRIWG
jgi:putative transposase